MSNLSFDCLSHWSNTNYVWQQYLAKQLLVPLVKDFSEDGKLFLVSAHYIESYNCKEIEGQYVVKVMLENGEIFYFATIADTYNGALECYKTISLIGLGDLEISLSQWLEIYPRYRNNFQVIEWVKNGK